MTLHYQGSLAVVHGKLCYPHCNWCLECEFSYLLNDKCWEEARVPVRATLLSHWKGVDKYHNLPDKREGDTSLVD